MMMRPLVGVLLLVLGVSSASIGLHAVAVGKDGAVVQLVVGLAIAWLLCRAAWQVLRPSRGALNQTPDSMAATASRWMRELERTRRFPIVLADRTNLPDGEYALISEDSRLLRGGGAKLRTSGGTRVMVGRQSFFFGRNESIARHKTQADSDGRLTLTDQALLFVGRAAALAIDLRQLKTIEPYSREAIMVTTDDDAPVVVFLVANPILWTLVVRLAAQVPFAGGHVPEVMQFDTGGASAPIPA